MAAMTTVLEEFSVNGNSKTYTVSSHTTVKPQLVISSRRVPGQNQTVAENTVRVVYATVDSAGDPIPDRVSFGATLRVPIYGASADVTAAKAVFRDFVASDEFDAMVSAQSHPA